MNYYNRYRTLQYNNNITSSGDYINRKKNRENLKFARNNFDNTSKTNLYSLECNLKKECYIKTPVCFDKEENLVTKYKFWKPEIYIATYQNYNTMINFLLEQATLNSDCYNCGDVPVTLDNGLTSEICYDDYYKKINQVDSYNCYNYNFCSNDCDKLTVKDINFCETTDNILYPYGNFNNNNPDITRKLRHRLVLKCDDKMLCPTYIYCKCPPSQDNCYCKCCDYTVIFPYKNTFIKYIVPGDDKANLYDFIRNPIHDSYKQYIELRNNKRLENISIKDFEKQIILNEEIYKKKF